MKDKGQNATIKINIKGDNEAFEVYEKIKELLHKTELNYFDHELDTYAMYTSGFRNNLDKVKSLN
jgi:hypothetical protein